MELKYDIVMSDTSLIVINVLQADKKMAKIHVTPYRVKLFLDSKKVQTDLFIGFYNAIMEYVDGLLENRTIEVIYEEGAI